MAFHTFGTHDELGWSPLDTEALEDLGLLFDVNLGGDEFGVDQVYDAFVRVDLGFQPSTAASGGCGAEIEESRFRLLLRGLQCLVRVREPVDGECDHDETLHGKTRPRGGVLRLVSYALTLGTGYQEIVTHRWSVRDK
jgi:hypothetical protein